MILEEGEPLFRRVYAWVETRNFAFGFDDIFMAPLADCLNHTHVKQNVFNFVNKKLHTEKFTEESVYFKDDKQRANMSLLYQTGSESDQAALKNETVLGPDLAQS